MGKRETSGGADEGADAQPNLVETLKETNVVFRARLRDGNEETVRSIDNLLGGFSEDLSLSAIVTRYKEEEEPRVIASTPIFLNKFGYDIDELLTLPCSKVLKVPEGVFNLPDLINLLRTSEAREFSISILDRGGEECVAYVLKGKAIPVTVYPSFFPKRRSITQIYTPLGIYRIGEVERYARGGFKAIRYNNVRKPSNYHEYMVNKGVGKIKALGRGEMKKLVHWDLRDQRTKKR